MMKIGSVIDGKYKILSLIGQGGMSNVYLAINEKANKTWAIKEVRKQGMKNFDIYRQSLSVELDLLKKMNHPNLPNIIDVIDMDDEFYIVMDYIEGVSLEKILEEKQRVEQQDVIEWALQLCDVLDYLHHQTPPVIYRDMKPSNIMLKPDGKVVLVDFGTAREYNSEKGQDTACLGTRGYAAPEQFGGMGQTDPRTDIYNLGATMYHLLTGHNPSMPPYEMYPIRHWDEQFSSGLEYIITTCTNQNPQERYQNVREFKYALEHYRELDESNIKRNRKRIAICAGCFVCGLICAMTSFVMHGKAQNLRREEYAYWLNQAEKMTDMQEKYSSLQKAMEISPQEKEAYYFFSDLLVEDGIFTNTEEVRLLEITASTDNVLMQFEEKNPLEYGSFCYQIGNAYWFYYQHEESRQVNAVAWYQSASEIFCNHEEFASEFQRCELFMEIGNFYKKIIAAQITGSDPGMYAQYWNQLMEWKKINDANPDRDLITVRMYLEIVSKATEYARYFAEDGISKEQIETCFEEILVHLNDMEKYATSNLNLEINQVREIIRHSEPMIQSSFEK